MQAQQAIKKALSILINNDSLSSLQKSEVVAVLSEALANSQPLSYDQIVSLAKHSHNVWDSVLLARSIEQAHGIK